MTRKAAADVLRVDVGDQAVLGVVGGRDRLVLGGEARDRRHRAEDLLAQHPGARRARRRRPSARRSSRARPRAPRRRGPCAPLPDRVLHQLARPSPRWSSSISGPTCDAGIGAAADLQLAHARGQPLGEVARDRLGHVEAVGARAGLAAVAHLREQRALDGGVEVGVLEDQERRVAAELHRDAQDLLGALLDELLADLGRAGEGELARPRVLDHRLHDRPGDLAVMTFSTPAGSPASSRIRGHAPASRAASAWPA